MKDAPLVSVIVPVYNTEPYLENCLQSILAQTHTNLEVICVDDGSTDHSAEVLRRFAELDPRVHVITQANAGVSKARNAGLDCASGEFITFVDSDDELEPDMYETLVRLAQEYDADIAHCGYKKFEKSGNIKDVRGTGELLVQSGEEAERCLLRGEYYTGSLCNKLFRRAILGGLRLDTAIRINEDVLLCAEAFYRAKKAVFLDETKYHYFQRAGSSSSRTKRIVKMKDTVAVAERIWELCRTSPLSEDAAQKYYKTLLNAYRTCLLADAKDHWEDRAKIRARADAVLPYCGAMSRKHRIHFFWLVHFPISYKAFYRVYDRIRKPNWDL